MTGRSVIGDSSRGAGVSRVPRGAGDDRIDLHREPCHARNRVGPIAQGIPRCPRCKLWVVDADADTFAAETTASVPVSSISGRRGAGPVG